MDDYEKLIATLTERCKVNGYGMALLKDSVVVMYSEDTLRKLLTKAEKNPSKTVILIVFPNQNVSEGSKVGIA